jgi:hypothetical protein
MDVDESAGLSALIMFIEHEDAQFALQDLIDFEQMYEFY